MNIWKLYFKFIFKNKYKIVILSELFNEQIFFEINAFFASMSLMYAFIYNILMILW
jgi:hypothetical protein